MYPKLDFNKKTILITGGAGFIGSNLAFYFQKNFPNSRLVIFDCFRSEELLSNGNLKSFGHINNLAGFKGEIICGDIVNKSDLSILNDFNFDYIFHQAAISDTRAYNQDLILRTNVNSFYNLLEIAKKNNSVMVYASSAATYGNLPSPQKVGSESPENPYGFSKYAMDQIAAQHIKNNPNLTLIGLRYFNVYGSREFYKGSTASMVIQLGHQILSGNAPRLFNNSENIMRDFVFIEDVIQANINASLSKKSGTYNIGSGIARSFQEIADILQKELKTDFITNYFPNPYSGYQSNTQADISPAKANLGYNPSFSLEEGIKKYTPEIIRLHELEAL